MTKLDEDQVVTVGMLRIVLQEAFEASEKRTGALIARAIARSEHNTAELIADLTTHIDARFNKLEKRMRKLEQNSERIENHSVRIGLLEAQMAQNWLKT